MYYFCQYNDLFTVPTNKNKLKYFCIEYSVTDFEMMQEN